MRVTSELYWVDASVPVPVAIAARPRAGDWLADEVENWRCSGVGVVVSLLEQEEVADLGLEHEQALCEQAGLRFASFPIRDRGLPPSAGQLVDFCKAILIHGEPILVHCRAGIGRSAVVATALLAVQGIPPKLALAAVSEARRLSVPDTDEQRSWLLALRASDMPEHP